MRVWGVVWSGVGWAHRQEQDKPAGLELVAAVIMSGPVMLHVKAVTKRAFCLAETRRFAQLWVLIEPPARQADLHPLLSPPRTRPTGRYHGKVAFGEVLRSNAEVAAALRVTSYPTLLALCGGSRDVVIKYEGKEGSTGLAHVWKQQGKGAGGERIQQGRAGGGMW